jgi:hypothetical protein
MTDPSRYDGRFPKPPYQTDDDRRDEIIAELVSALDDMLAGWRYIRCNYGDLYGVGWDRCEKSAAAAIEKATGE